MRTIVIMTATFANAPLNKIRQFYAIKATKIIFIYNVTDTTTTAQSN